MNIGKSDESAPDEESDRSFVESRLLDGEDLFAVAVVTAAAVW